MSQPPRAAYPGYAFAPNSYGRPRPAAAWSHHESDRVHRALCAIVAVLGLSSFGFGLGAPGSLVVPVTLSVLAAVIAAASILPGQSDHGWVVAAAAVTGFLDAVAASTTVNAGWEALAATVVGALQALVAVIALLRRTRITQAAMSEAEADYRAYVKMVRSYQAYAAHAQQSPPAEFGTGAQATAQAYAPAGGQTGRGHSDDVDEYEALQAKYAQHGADAAHDPHRTATGPQAARAKDHDPGVPGTGRAVFEPPGYGARTDPGDGRVGSAGP